jgi:hypothetical protein
LATIALVVALGLIVVACSSEPGPAANATTSPAPTTTTAAPTTSTSTTTTTTTTVPAPVALHRAIDGTRPLRVMVVGDSVAETFAGGLERWAQETGRAVVLDESREWCSLGRNLARNVFGPQNATAGCDDWATRWAESVRSFDPDVVLVMFTIWEVVPRKLAGAADFTRPGDPAIDAWQLSEYQQAADVLSAGGAPVVWFSVACEGTPIVRGEPFWYVNRRTIPALARSRPAVRLIDLDAFLCHGPRVVTDLGGVADIRPDGAHFSEPGAVAISRWVMPIVFGEQPAPRYATG